MALPVARVRPSGALAGSEMLLTCWMWVRPLGLQPIACRGRQLVGSDASCRLRAGSPIACRWPSPARGVAQGIGTQTTRSAVIREFDSKADKANLQASGDDSARDAVIELEQAGDSAKAAAEADPDLGESAREAVLDAHLAICILKTEI